MKPLQMYNTTLVFAVFNLLKAKQRKILQICVILGLSLFYMYNTSPLLSNDQVLEILTQTKTATAIHIGEGATIQFANDAMINIWGKDRSVIGKTLEEALPELEGQPFIEMFAKVWREGLTLSGSNTPAELVVDGHKQTFYFDFEYKAILDKDGKTICILHTAVDVTDRLMKQSAVEKAMETQGFLLREQAQNEELAASNEELESLNEELSATFEELEKTKEGLKLFNEELESKVKERTETISLLYQELEAASEELRASNEELTATNEELSKSRGQLEKLMVNLAASEYRTRNIIESAPFPIGVYIGREMRISLVNKSITTVWGKGEDVVGKKYADILPELENQSVFDQLDKVFTTGKPFEARNQRIDLKIAGELQVFYFNYNFTALRDKSGEIYGVMNTAAEVTDLFQAKQEIQRAAEETAVLNRELEEINEEMAALNEELTASNEEMLEFNQQLKSLNERLRISQDETELAIKAAGLGTFDLNPVKGVFSGNQLLKSWFGLNPDDHIELQKATDVIAEHDREKVISAIENALDYTSGGDYDTYYSIVTPLNPTPRIVRAKGKTLFDSNQKAIRLSGVLQDVTELVTSQQKMEKLNKELAASEKKFRTLIKKAPVAINLFRTDELIIESANDKMLEIWNKQTDVEGKTFAQALPEIADQPFISILADTLASGKPYQGLESKTIINNDGILEERYFNFIYQPIVDDDEHINSIVQVATEVTEQVNSRKEILEINTRLNIAIEAGALGSTEVNLCTGKMESNERFKNCFGRTKEEEFTYNDFFETMLPEHRENVQKAIAFALKNHSVYKAEYEVQWPDGSLHWISAHGRARYDSMGKATTMVSIISDITEAKADEQRKNDFIAMVSHELKTPLTSLTGYVQLLQIKAKKNEDSFAGQALEKANNQLKKMTTMINSFLNVSRLESGKIHIEKQNFDLNLLVNEVEKEFSIVAHSHQLTFEPQNEIFVHADRDKIGHVISNFISNAVKYAPAGSHVYISSKIEDNFIQVAVRDEGSGIREEDKLHLFERYYRVVDQPTTIAGFGIGLYLCAEIINRHHGNIWVESELGKGSTFYFTLPIT